MTKSILWLIIGCTLFSSSLFAQQIFKGKLSYRVTQSNPSDSLSETHGHIITDGKKFRHCLMNPLKGKEEIVFEADKKIVYLVKHRTKKILKAKLPTKFFGNNSKVTVQHTEEIKKIANETARKTIVYERGIKAAEIWISDRYKWNLTGKYGVNHVLYGISSVLFHDHIILEIQAYDASRKAQKKIVVSHLDKGNIPPHTFDLPKGFKIIDKTKKR